MKKIVKIFLQIVCVSCTLITLSLAGASDINARLVAGGDDPTEAEYIFFQGDIVVFILIAIASGIWVWAINEQEK